MNTLVTLAKTLVPCLILLAACGDAAAPATTRPAATAAPPTPAPATATAPPSTAPPPAPTRSPAPTAAPAPPTPQASSSGLPIITPSPGKGNVEGQVVWNSKPAPGIQLRLCAEMDPISGCKGASHQAVSNAGGAFRFVDVAPGDYGLAMRVFDTNDWLFVTSEFQGARTFAVKAGETLDVRTQNLFKTDLKLGAPASAANLTSATPVLKWQSYESAAYYQVYLGADHGDAIFVNERVEAAELAVAEPLLNCAYNWKVEAFNAAKFKIAESDRLRFKVTGQAAGCEIALVAPAAGVKTVPASGLKLAWKAHPLAAHYKVVLYDPERADGEKVLDFVRVTDTQYAVTETLDPGEYLWWVQAHDDTDRMVADSQPVSLQVK